MAGLHLHARDLDLHLSDPFTISRGTQDVAHNVLVRLSSPDDPAEQSGLGEAAPSSHYGEWRASVNAYLREVNESGRDVFGVEGAGPASLVPFDDLHRRLEQIAHLNPAAKAAVDMAVYDLLGKRHGLPVWAMLGASPTRAPQTSFTIGIDTPERMAEKTRAALARLYPAWAVPTGGGAPGAPILKVKVGTPRDGENLEAIRRAAPHARLRVDANAAWTAKEAIAAIRDLESFNLEFVEQPCAGHDLEGMRLVRERVHLPIIADESCVVLHDVQRVAACVDGINIKLMKCGGIYPALQMIFAARALGLRTMLGCMIESSVAITAAAHLSPLVDYADLDGHLLVGDDPYRGVIVEEGRLILPAAPGLGLTEAPSGGA